MATIKEGEGHVQANSWRYWITLFMKGLVMGAADVVPGISGGTIAFITGIYTRLLHALKSLHPLSLHILWQQGFRAFWHAIDGRFLLILFSGIFLSIISLAKVIHYALDHFPITVWSFFFGLVVASIIHLIRQINQWRGYEYAALLSGTLIALAIAVMRPVELPAEWWMMMVSGFIAICAMILPGISGSFILLMMGMYEVFIHALSEFNIPLLAGFVAGCVMGLLAFSHLLSFLLKHYFSVMIALLTGFLVGSLHVLWPWKQVLATRINRQGETVPLLQENILPHTFEALTQEPARIVTVIVAAFAGFLIVVALEIMSSKN